MGGVRYKKGHRPGRRLPRWFEDAHIDDAIERFKSNAISAKRKEWGANGAPENRPFDLEWEQRKADISIAVFTVLIRRAAAKARAGNHSIRWVATNMNWSAGYMYRFVTGDCQRYGFNMFMDFCRYLEVSPIVIFKEAERLVGKTITHKKRSIAEDLESVLLRVRTLENEKAQTEGKSE